MKKNSMILTLLSGFIFRLVYCEGTLSMYLRHGDKRCLSEMFHRQSKAHFMIAATTESKNVDAKKVSVEVRVMNKTLKCASF